MSATGTNYTINKSTLDEQLATYDVITKIRDSKTLDSVYKNKLAQRADIDVDIDNDKSELDTNIQRVIYETDAEKQIYHMRILLFVLYGIASLAFLYIYVTSFDELKNGITRLKIVSVSTLLILFPFFIINIIYSIKYIFTIPKLVYPDTMP